MRYFPRKEKLKLHDPNKSLSDIANELETDKGTATQLSWSKHWPQHTTMGYTVTYEKYMNPLRNVPVKLFELGIRDQRFPYASQKMWLKFFEEVELYGMDNFWGKHLADKLDEITALNELGCHFIYADQGSFCDWDELKQAIPHDFDFFVEDGSHWPNHMVVTLWQAKDLLKSGGYYFMEDLQNPVTARGKFRYDNSLLTEELLMTQHTGILNTAFLNDKQNAEVQQNFELIELVLDNHHINYLAVFRKK